MTEGCFEGKVSDNVDIARRPGKIVSIIYQQRLIF